MGFASVMMGGGDDVGVDAPLRYVVQGGAEGGREGGGGGGGVSRITDDEEAPLTLFSPSSLLSMMITDGARTRARSSSRSPATTSSPIRREDSADLFPRSSSSSRTPNFDSTTLRIGLRSGSLKSLTLRARLTGGDPSFLLLPLPSSITPLAPAGDTVPSSWRPQPVSLPSK